MPHQFSQVSLGAQQVSPGTGTLTTPTCRPDVSRAPGILTRPQAGVLNFGEDKSDVGTSLLFPAAVLAGAKRSRTCLRGLHGELDFETRTLFLVDPRWLVPCCNGIIVWLSSLLERF